MADKFQKGDWVAELDVRQPHFGVVKEAWEDGSIDIVMYTWNGEKVGRLSPPEGGPTSFEPCCSSERYAKIEKPDFPLTRDFGDWRNSLKFI